MLFDWMTHFTLGIRAAYSWRIAQCRAVKRSFHGRSVRKSTSELGGRRALCLLNTWRWNRKPISPTEDCHGPCGRCLANEGLTIPNRRTSFPWTEMNYWLLLYTRYTLRIPIRRCLEGFTRSRVCRRVDFRIFHCDGPMCTIFNYFGLLFDNKALWSLKKEFSLLPPKNLWCTFQGRYKKCKKSD